jgi:DeoR/GlpR family transcriptional regulator of sugar metabolism
VTKKRRQEIVNLLKSNLFVTVDELCVRLDASPATIRRDLVELERNSEIKRVNGGAISISQPPENRVSGLAGKAGDPLLQQKKAIARAAVAMVREGDTIFIDSGSTNNQIADLLASFSNISIVTNSIEIAYNFIRKKDISVVICGGTISEVSPVESIVGPLAELMISQFRANLCFMGTSGIDLKHGITDPYLSAASFKAKMIEYSSKVVLVTDHSKFGRVNKAFVAETSVIHHVITDSLVPGTTVEALLKMGIPVTLADSLQQ